MTGQSLKSYKPKRTAKYNNDWRRDYVASLMYGVDRIPSLTSTLASCAGKPVYRKSNLVTNIIKK